MTSTLVQTLSRRSRTGPGRSDAVALGVVALLVGVTAWVANRPGSPVQTPFSSATPLYGQWMPHVGPGTAAALPIALAVVVYGPGLARRMRWRVALLATYVTAVAWTLSLVMIDGWQRGLADQLTVRTEYLYEVPDITDIGRFVSGFVEHIPRGPEPVSWTTHVAGHPPGATLVFLVLDRIGLGGGVPASLACVFVGTLAAVAVPVTVRALGSQDAARTVLPFAVLFPGAVWIGASADGLFAGVSAVGIALLALAATRRGPRADAFALAGGLVLGYTLYMSYGLVLLAPLVLAVALLSRRVRPLAVGAVGVAAVAVAFLLAGFWWLDGYQAVVARYNEGIATIRSYRYWVFGNLAAFALSAGPLAARVAPSAALRVREWAATRTARRLSAAVVLVTAAAVAVLVADLSGLSKAETERIWLPFAVWFVAGAALLPTGSRRFWLVVQAVVTLAVNHLVLTVW